MQTENDPLLTTDEVSDELSIDVRTLYKMLRAGKIPHLDLGHRTKRIRRSDLDAYLAECERAADGCN